MELRGQASGTRHANHPGEYVFIGVGLAAAFSALRHITKLAKAAVAKGGPTSP